jgi:hypothetical protein
MVPHGGRGGKLGRLGSDPAERRKALGSNGSRTEDTEVFWVCAFRSVESQTPAKTSIIESKRAPQNLRVLRALRASILPAPLWVPARFRGVAIPRQKPRLSNQSVPPKPPCPPFPSVSSVRTPPSKRNFQTTGAKNRIIAAPIRLKHQIKSRLIQERRKIAKPMKS